MSTISPRKTEEAEAPLLTPLKSPLPEGWTRGLLRRAYLLHYHRKSQVLRRLLRLARRRLFPSAARDLPLVESIETVPLTAGWRRLAARKLQDRRLRGADRRAAQLLRGEFEFLHHAIPASDPLDWRQLAKDAPHLWRFQLHYHEFLLDLAAAEPAEREARHQKLAWERVQSWIHQFPMPDRSAVDDAWHPFCISRRLPCWFTLWTISPPDEELVSSVLESAARQADYLAANLETDLGGNHLFENAKALVLAASFCRGGPADHWRDVGIRILQRELPRQFLDSGEHFERSPMYHALMLEGLLDLADALDETSASLSGELGQCIRKAASFLEDILHPDGSLPLFADSTHEQAPDPCGLIAEARSTFSSTFDTEFRPEPSRRRGGYWLYQDTDDFLIFDAGPVGADHLPAHAHADLLTCEISLFGQPWIVDGGVFDYEDSSMRRYCRSAVAHNVVTIDGTEPIDMWSKFRVGYRGHPSPLRETCEEEFSCAWAWHNAYRRLGVSRLGRWWACRPGGPWFCVERAEGKGRHELRGRLHLHPDVKVARQDPDACKLSRGAESAHISFFGPGRLELRSGWYCPEFGLRIKNTVLEWIVDAELPACFGWQLAWREPPAKSKLIMRPGEKPLLHDESDEGSTTLHPFPDDVK